MSNIRIINFTFFSKGAIMKNVIRNYVSSNKLVNTLGNISNFDVLGPLYANNNTQFIWNAILEEGIKYDLQYSSNTS
mgnify:CR=1 FL=1